METGKPPQITVLSRQPFRPICETYQALRMVVYQAPSMAYIPDVGRVYAEVARVLRTGGYYRVAHTNPAIEFIEMSS
jgi:hypothetical protein